jgi:hypothetical protein
LTNLAVNAQGFLHLESSPFFAAVIPSEVWAKISSWLSNVFENQQRVRQEDGFFHPNQWLGFWPDFCIQQPASVTGRQQRMKARMPRACRVIP